MNNRTPKETKARKQASRLLRCLAPRCRNVPVAQNLLCGACLRRLSRNLKAAGLRPELAS